MKIDVFFFLLDIVFRCSPCGWDGELLATVCVIVFVCVNVSYLLSLDRGSRTDIQNVTSNSTLSSKWFLSQITGELKAEAVI